MTLVYCPKPLGDLTWLDRDKNEYRVHIVMLTRFSPVLRDLDWSETKCIEANYSPEATLVFMKYIYEADVSNLTAHCFDETYKMFLHYGLPLQDLEVHALNQRFKRVPDLHHDVPPFTRETWPLQQDKANLQIGDYCAVIDQTNVLYMACITDLRKDAYRVHFVGWSCGEDMWIFRDSDKLFSRHETEFPDSQALAVKHPKPWRHSLLHDFCEVYCAGEWCKAKIVKETSEAFTLCVFSAYTSRCHLTVRRRNCTELAVCGTHLTSMTSAPKKALFLT